MGGWENVPYVFNVAPPPEPTDIPVGETPDCFPTTRDHGKVSRESTPGLYSLSPSVLRLGFESIDPPSVRGFEIGSEPTSDIRVPYYCTNPSKTSLKAYFRIHYNFDSGALLITALNKIKVGSARLKEQQSLLLMSGTSIYCGGESEFTVEFPDLSHCAEEHERNYQKYAAEALKNKTAGLFAIKILRGGGECEMKEVNILSRLCHVSLCICLLCAIY